MRSNLAVSCSKASVLLLCGPRKWKKWAISESWCQKFFFFLSLSLLCHKAGLKRGLALTLYLNYLSDYPYIKGVCFVFLKRALLKGNVVVVVFLEFNWRDFNINFDSNIEQLHLIIIVCWENITRYVDSWFVLVWRVLKPSSSNIKPFTKWTFFSGVGWGNCNVCKNFITWCLVLYLHWLLSLIYCFHPPARGLQPQISNPAQTRYSASLFVKLKVNVLLCAVPVQINTITNTNQVQSEWLFS